MDSGIYSENTADNMVKCKPYNRLIRAHNLTFEAVRRVLIGEFVNWLPTSGRGIDNDFIDDVACDLVKAFQSDDRHAGRRAMEAMKAHYQRLTVYFKISSLNTYTNTHFSTGLIT